MAWPRTSARAMAAACERAPDAMRGPWLLFQAFIVPRGRKLSFLSDQTLHLSLVPPALRALLSGLKKRAGREPEGSRSPPGPANTPGEMALDAGPSFPVPSLPPPAGCSYLLFGPCNSFLANLLPSRLSPLRAVCSSRYQQLFPLAPCLQHTALHTCQPKPNSSDGHSGSFRA